VCTHVGSVFEHRMHEQLRPDLRLNLGHLLDKPAPCFAALALYLSLCMVPGLRILAWLLRCLRAYCLVMPTELCALYYTLDQVAG
jgi:hypothetical protein